MVSALVCMGRYWGGGRRRCGCRGRVGNPQQLSVGCAGANERSAYGLLWGELGVHMSTHLQCLSVRRPAFVNLPGLCVMGLLCISCGSQGSGQTVIELELCG